MTGIVSRTMWKTNPRFFPTTSSQSAAVVLSIEAIAPGRSRSYDAPTLVLCTSTSIRPRHSNAASTARLAPRSSARSTSTASGSPPAALISTTSASSSGRRRATQTIVAPSRAKIRAVAAPTPELAPVTIETRPARRRYAI
jgi:hypothetical protein